MTRPDRPLDDLAQREDDEGPCETSIPRWVTYPIPVDAIPDEKLNKRVLKACNVLPKDSWELRFILGESSRKLSYDIAVNLACEQIWKKYVEGHFSSPAARKTLASLAMQIFPPRARARIIRGLAKDSSLEVRRYIEKQLAKANFHEVALPRSRNAPPESEDALWDHHGWQHGMRKRRTGTSCER